MSEVRLAFRDISYNRGSNQILTGVNWTVRSNEHWAVLGPNGSGKTTLFRIAAGYEASSAGRTYLLEGWQGEICLPEVRKRVAFISGAIEDYLLRWRGETTGLEVVLSGQKTWLGPVKPGSGEENRRALSLLSSYGAARLENQPFVLMSTGERKICLLARARMADHQILLLDEPCAGLDVGAREDLLAAIDRGIREQPCIPNILITHHPDEIGNGISHILLLRQGRVVAQGAKEETLTKANLQKTFDREFRLYVDEGRYWARGIQDRESLSGRNESAT